MSRPPRPGDIFRVGRYFHRRRLDEGSLDFLRVNFDTSSPGLARVIEVRQDGVVAELWSHRFLITEAASLPNIRRLSRLEAMFAPERIGEAILRREVRASRVVVSSDRRPTWQPLVRAWLRSTRGCLPILEALGGQIHAPMRRKAKAKLFYWLGRLGIMPPHSGFLDYGMLVERIGATVEMEYHGRDRTVWLDHIPAAQEPFHPPTTTNSVPSGWTASTTCLSLLPRLRTIIEWWDSHPPQRPEQP